MITILKNLFSPVNFPESEVKNRLSRMLYLFWLSTCALVGLNVIGISFVFVKKFEASVLMAFFILILVIVRYLHLRGNIQIASFVFILGVWIAYMTVVVLSGTIKTSAIAIPIVMVAMVIPLLGLQAGIVCAILTLLVTLGITILEMRGYPLPSYFPRSPLSNWFHLVTAFTIVIVPLGQAWKDISNTLTRAQKSENKHRLLFEEANDGIFIIKNSYFADCNTKILEMFRMKREEIIGKRPYELSPTFQPNGKRTIVMEQEMLNEALAGEHKMFEWRHLRSDNTEFDVEVSLNLLELDKEQFVQAIVRDITDRKLAERKLAEAYDTTLEGWANALELRDKETENHSRRVVKLTIILAKAMGIEGDELVHIRRGAILHDIGKMGIPDDILLKPGKLTPSEREIIKKHPIYSYELLSHIPHLEKSMDIPYCHHERWDGSGYPQGLKGDEIPLTARIFAIIDVWDALQSDRPYGKVWSKEETIAYITKGSGKHFDPDIARVFLKLVEKDEI